MSLFDDLRLYRPDKVQGIVNVASCIKEPTAEELLVERANINRFRIENKLYDLRQKGDDRYYDDDYDDYIKSIQFIDRKKLLCGDDKLQGYGGVVPMIYAGVKYKIYRWLREKYPDHEQDPHEKVAVRVYDRLRLRNAQLRELEEQARGYLVNGDLRLNSAKGSYSVKNQDVSAVGIRAYRLAVTDLFVEKAMTYLEDRAEEYKKIGGRNIRLGQIAYVLGAVIALVGISHLWDYDYSFSLSHFGRRHVNVYTEQYGYYDITKEIKKYDTNGRVIQDETERRKEKIEPWFTDFTKSFSALGMVVLVGVSRMRYGKVMIEQAERLLERRHALRQGRLFVHLNDGNLSIKEIEAAFNWNVSEPNAFSHLPTEAQAPWGTVVKEFMQKFPDLVKSGIETFSKKK